MKEIAWLVVANASIARIFEVETLNAFSEVETMIHEASKLKDSEIASDRQGRTKDRFGFSRHALEPEVTPHEAEMQVFAHQVAHFLEEARKQNRFHRLYLASSPHFLGLLRDALPKQTSKLIDQSFSKDLTSFKPSEFSKHITVRVPL